MLLSHLPLKCLVVHGEYILWHSLGFNAYVSRVRFCHGSYVGWVWCPSVHFKGFSPGTPVISTSQKPASANSNSTRVGPTWKPKSRYFNFTRKKLQSWPLAVGTPSLLRAKTHDFFTFQKNTNRSKKKHPFPLETLNENEVILKTRSNAVKNEKGH